MKGRIVRRLGAAVVVMLCLAATAWAGLLEFETFNCTLNGVDGSGHLTQTGSDNTTFFALENTLFGTLTGTAKGCVMNQTRFAHVYVNANFGTIWCGESGWSDTVEVFSSLYTVYPPGTCSSSPDGGNALATLIAVGSDEKCPGDP